jgi:hypothetical protein
MKLSQNACKVLLVSSTVALGILWLGAVSAWAVDQDTIVMKNGNTLVGQIVFGVAPVLSIEDTDGKTSTVNQSNVKVLRFGEPAKKEDVIETFDGNILTGQVAGVHDILGLQSGGDVLPIKKINIKEIRFGGAAPAQTVPQPQPQPAQPALPSGPTATCGQRSAPMHALASLIIPGLGQVLNGESWLKAGAYLVSSLLLWPINALASAIDAYISADRMNRCEKPLLGATGQAG